MIDGISMTGIPTQQPRTVTDDGIRVTPVKTEVKTDSTNQFNDKNLQQNDQQNKEKLKEIVKSINDFLQPSHTSLQFKLHEKLNEYYVTIVDTDTNQVVQEIPPKRLLDIYAAMEERLGFLVDRKI